MGRATKPNEKPGCTRLYGREKVDVEGQMCLRHHNFSRLPSRAQRAKGISSFLISLFWEPKDRHSRRTSFIFFFFSKWAAGLGGLVVLFCAIPRAHQTDLQGGAGFLL